MCCISERGVLEPLESHSLAMMIVMMAMIVNDEEDENN